MEGIAPEISTQQRPASANGSKSEVFLPARHVRCTLKGGRR